MPSIKTYRQHIKYTRLSRKCQLFQKDGTKLFRFLSYAFSDTLGLNFYTFYRFNEKFHQYIRDWDFITEESLYTN